MSARPHPPNGSETRCLSCDDYGSCLSVAASGRWNGLDCSRCPRFEDEQQTVIRERVRVMDEPLDSDALATLAALVKAEHAEGGPAGSRAVGAFLGIGGKAASLLLTDLEGRGHVRRLDGNGIRWSVT